VFDQPARAELGAHASAAALRGALRTELAADFYPTSGYWLVGLGQARADYIARSESIDSPFVFASFEIQSGTWKLSWSGACHPSLVLDGLSVATFGLDPASPPDRQARSFTAKVTEIACTGGQPMGDRLLPPSVTYAPGAVIVFFSARPLSGDHDCPGNPPTRVVVELREPLGGRRLLDGAFFPPADPNAPAF
jgi:hypothetical protein